MEKRLLPCSMEARAEMADTGLCRGPEAFDAFLA